jgi:hypothetical protein
MRGGTRRYMRRVKRRDGKWISWSEVAERSGNGENHVFRTQRPSYRYTSSGVKILTVPGQASSSAPPVSSSSLSRASRSSESSKRVTEITERERAW